MLFFMVLWSCGRDSSVKAFNSEPLVEISSHSDNDEVLEGYPALFRGIVSDPNDAAADLTATWYAGERILCDAEVPSEDGTTICEAVLDSLDTEITLEARDDQNAAGSESVAITIVPSASPEAEIISPLPSVRYYSDYPISFEGQISDAEEVAASLSASWGSEFEDWASTLTQLATFPTEDGLINGGTAYLVQGNHAVTLSVEDSSGKTGYTNVVIEVGGPNSIPECAITAPQNGGAGEVGTLLILEGSATDVDIPASQLMVEWRSDKDGVLGTSSPDSTGAVTFAYSDLSINTHTISMEVRDEMGESCAAQLIFTIGTAPEIVIDSPTSAQVWNDDTTIMMTATITDNEDASEQLAVIWSSSVDGELSTQSPDTNGLVSFARNDLSLGTHTLTVEATDPVGLTSSRTVDFVHNGLPSQPTVTIVPDPPTSADDLVATAANSVDPEQQAVSYAYEWYRNGSTTGLTGATLSASETTRGEVWTVYAVADDGFGQGPAGSNSVTIDNSAPTISSVILSPSNPAATDTITCTVAYTEPDNELVSITYAWQQNGNQVGGNSDSLDLQAISAIPTDTIECTVVVADTSNASDSDSAALTIVNSAPVVSNMNIAPNPAYVNSLLQCSADTDDPDGESLLIAYTWRDSSGVQLGNNATLQLDSSFVSAGETIECEIVAQDGFGGVHSATTDITIDDAYPTVDSVEITPNADLYRGTVLSCVAMISDIEDGPLHPSYTWYNLTTLSSLGSGDSLLLSATNTSRGDEIECQVTAIDSANQSVFDSASITVENAPPVASNLSLLPSTVYTDSSVSVSASYSDADGDSVTPTYLWYVDGGLVVETSNTLDGNIYFEKGQSIQVSVVPNDGLEDGQSISSANITVANSTPSDPSVQLTPALPVENVDDILCTIAGSTDADSQDSVSYVYRWERNGVAYVGTTTNNGLGVASTHLTPEDEWQCFAYATDGSANSAEIASSLVTILYYDQDGDGSVGLNDCDDNDPWWNDLDVDGDGFSTCDGDCDDADATRSPIDSDNDGYSSCDGDCDDTDANLNLDDQDGDGQGTCDGDCDDSRDDIYAGAAEHESAIDCMLDSDDDGYGEINVPAISGLVAGSDCDDADPWRFPYAAELIQDGVDQDCDGVDLQAALRPGRYHSCGIDTTQQIRCWGANTYNQREAPSGLYQQLDSGNAYSCALDQNGEVVCWGSNANNVVTSAPSGSFVQLSVGRTTNCGLDIDGYVTCWGAGFPNVSAYPDEQFVFVAAGSSSACGIRKDGTLSCWDANYSASANAVPSESFRTISMYEDHSCGVLDDSSLYCWGSNNYSVISNMPVGTGYHNVQVGHNFACAIDGSDNLDCWGVNSQSQALPPSGSFAQLGVGHEHACATDVQGTPSCWGKNQYLEATQPGLYQQVATGNLHSCALRDTGELLCWGYSQYGLVEDTPTGNDFEQLVAGYDHNCALDSSGSVTCWGRDLHGLVSNVPAGSFTTLTAGNYLNCALDSGGFASCWGRDNYGEVSNVPSVALTQISAGGYHACGVDNANQLYCWGIENSGIIDHGQVTDTPSGSFIQVTAGGGHNCALENTGAVTCWGNNDYLQSSPPSGIVLESIDANIDEAQFARSYTCGLESTGTVQCWGDNSSGQGTPPNQTFTDITTGGMHSCGIDTEGGIHCWGFNNNSQIWGPGTWVY